MLVINIFPVAKLDQADRLMGDSLSLRNEMSRIRNAGVKNRLPLKAWCEFGVRGAGGLDPA